MGRKVAYDRWMFLTAALLVMSGLLMVGSSSNYYALDRSNSPSALYLKQGLHMLAGFLALIVGMRLPYRKLDRRGVMLLLFIGCVVALGLVLAMPSAGGAHRWYPVGPVKFQPSEFVKLFVVAFMAYMLSRKGDQVNDLWRVPIPCLAVVGTLAYLVYIEPDLGSAVMMLGVAAVMTFVAGLRWRYIAVVAAISGILLVGAIYAEPYRMERVRAWTQTWIDPTAESLGSNYQLHQSLIAIGSGGITGVGLGQGQQKAFYVPASHTDFIFSVVGEELGLLGTGTLLLLFVVIFWRGMRAVKGAPDEFGAYLALGITCLLVLQALVNMSVCVGLLPTKGLPLPLISYGGSSLMASMGALGLLCNISQHPN